MGCLVSEMAVLDAWKTFKRPFGRVDPLIPPPTRQTPADLLELSPKTPNSPLIAAFVVAFCSGVADYPRVSH
jgi:hypothetical protein